MKRFLLGFTVFLTVSVIVLFLFLRTKSGFRSIYLVPDNAVLLIDTKDPLGAWDKVVSSEAWNHLRTNKALADVNLEIESFDSLVNSNRIYMKLLGQKPLLVSQHPIGNKYDFLYIFELGKLGKYKNPEKLFSSVLGKGFEVTSRTHNTHKVVEILDLSEGVYFFLSFIKGKLIFSFSPQLIEASIDASEITRMGNEHGFLKVYSKLRDNGLASFYINHQNLGPFLTYLSPDLKADIGKSSQFQYTGLSFDINEEDLLTFEGYSSLNDTLNHSFLSLLKNKNLEPSALDVIPSRIASMVKINFDDANNYFNASMRLLGEEESYNSDISGFEKKFKINLQENFFSWMEDEILLLQTQPSNLGRNNEFAVILHAKDSVEASENLSYVWRQIKKNSPVKVKSVNYKGYNIDYIAFPGFLKVLFGKLLDRIERPYFTQVADNVIISNHPQTLKNLIDDYLISSTLGSSVSFYNFSKNFDSKTSMFLYFEPPVLFYNIREFLSPKAWSNFSNNKDYFTCFSQAGIQVNEEDGLMHFSLKAQYQSQIINWQKQYYNPQEIMSMFINQPGSQQKPVTDEASDTIPKIIIHTLDDSKQEEYYEDGTLKRFIELKNGLKHGDFKEYHENGKLRIKGSFSKDKPTGKWKYFDEEGNLIKTNKY